MDVAQHKRIVLGLVYCRFVWGTFQNCGSESARRFFASADNGPLEQQCRFGLSDPLTLYVGENAKLAPGYGTPATRTKPK